jgi:hypothetical protein
MADNRFLNKQRAMQRMRAIPPAVRVAARQAVNYQAEGLAQAIRAAVPRDEGDLADSIEAVPHLRGDKISAAVREGWDDETLGRKARAVEFGRGGENPMEPQPHFFPTFRALRRRMQAGIQRKVRAAIRRIYPS